MKKPKLLDLYCKAGGAGMGYSLAGFEVTGIDIQPQPNYPFRFIQYDAVAYLRRYGHLYDAIHASPPCQFASRSTAPHRANNKEYFNLIPKTRAELDKCGKPYVIENVRGAGLRPDIILSGPMFNLKVIRVRHFETGYWMMLQQPITEPVGTVINGDYCSVFGKCSSDRAPNRFGKKTIREAWSYAMGIDWHMKEAEIAEAIPPAYTKYIGIQLINQLK